MGERKELLDHSQEPVILRRFVKIVLILLFKDKLEPAFDANAFFGKSEEQNVEALFAEPHQEEKKAPSSNARFWNVEYYSFLFDVDTKDVTIRLLRSLLPYPPKFFDIIKPNPDLYVPFHLLFHFIRFHFTLSVQCVIKSTAMDHFG
jgi:hypothetical protein